MKICKAGCRLRHYPHTIINCFHFPHFRCRLLTCFFSLLSTSSKEQLKLTMRSFTHFLLSLGTVVGAQRLEAGISNLTLQACEDFGNSLSLENVTINVVEYLPKGTNLTISQDYELSTCGYRFVIIERDLCRIAMNVKTSGRSGKLHCHSIRCLSRLNQIEIDTWNSAH